MFESAALSHDLSKQDFDKVEPRLREDLLDAQFDLVEARRKSVLILINGSDGAGKGELLGRFYEWLDPHHLDTLSYFSPTQDERQRPPYWRFWRDMPGHGRIGMVLGSWYHPALDGRARGLLDEAEGHAQRAGKMVAAVLESWEQPPGSLYAADALEALACCHVSRGRHKAARAVLSFVAAIRAHCPLGRNSHRLALWA
jgi:hypothetical protein